MQAATGSMAAATQKPLRLRLHELYEAEIFDKQAIGPVLHHFTLHRILSCSSRNVNIKCCVETSFSQSLHEVETSQGGQLEA